MRDHGHAYNHNRPIDDHRDTHRVLPRTGEVGDEVLLDLGEVTSFQPTGLAGAKARGAIFASNRLYVPDEGYQYEIIEFDAESGSVIDRFSTGEPQVTSLAYIDGLLYASTDSAQQTIVLYDPDTGLPVPPGSTPSSPPPQSPSPAGMPDRYTIDLFAGQQVTIRTSTPYSSAVAGLINNLDPILRLYHPDGYQLAVDDNSVSDGKNSSLSFTTPAGGTYTVVIGAVSGSGEYLLAIDTAPFLPSDLDGNGLVGLEDLNRVLSHWNESVTVNDISTGDTDGDGFVGLNDLNIVLRHWNNTLPDPRRLGRGRVRRHKQP